MKNSLVVILFIAIQSASAQPYGQWSQAINLGPPVNSVSDEWGPSINSEENVIVLHTARGTNRGLFVSRKVQGVWGNLEYLSTVQDPANLETGISPDGNEVYFSCYCGGYGDYDIWKVVRDTINNTWSAPINLGPNVNDEWGQQAPFLSYDGQSLYHIEHSERYPYDGLAINHWTGSEWGPIEGTNLYFSEAEDASITMNEDEIFFDKWVVDIGPQVFYSQKDSNGNWINPCLFTPINNYGIGYYPKVNADGSRVYFECGIAGGFGGSDIWYVEKLLDAVENENNMLPSSLSLSNYPNPFNSSTTLYIDRADQAEINIFDITGRRVAMLHAEQGKGVWDASSFSSGLYFARVAGEDVSKSIKLILLK